MDSEAKGRPGAVAGGGASAASTFNAFCVMEDIVDKLKALNYENDFCRKLDLPRLSRTYFVAAEKKASEQFPMFSSLCAWLLKELAVDFLQWTDFEDPNVVTTQIMEEIKKLGYKPDFPATKLRHGNGDAVVITLNFLCDRLLQRRGFKVQVPSYKQAELTEEAVVDDQAEIAEAGGVEEEVAEDDGLGDADGVGGGGGGSKSDEKDDEKVTQGVLEAKVDPIAWKLELERVGPKLKFKATTTSKEWRTHLEQSIKHRQALIDTYPESKIALTKIGKELKKSIDRISGKEKHINKDFDHLGADFRDKQNKVNALQKRVDELNAVIAELTAELASKSEEVENVKNQTEARNTSMVDNSPVKRIQAALTSLKKEVAAMELRIGVVGQTLMQSKTKRPTAAY